MERDIHAHPKPWINRLIQYGALAVTVILTVSAPLQIALTLAGAPGGLFICSAIVTLALAAPVLMLTAYAPEVAVDSEGLTLRPVIWKSRWIPWDQIAEVRVYRLLPSPDAEISRQIVVGRRRYRPSMGILLVIPGLPPQYRIVGFFAGVQAQPAIALTNRAHVDYERLLETTLKHTDPATHETDLIIDS